MDNADVAAHLENLDHRVDRVEQILPTLATKDDLLATKEDLRREIQLAIEPLGTKEDLQRAIQAAVAPLATKEELQALSRRMDVQFEALRDDIQLVALEAEWDELHGSATITRLPDNPITRSR